MIPIVVTGTLLIIVVLYAIIDGTIFENDNPVSKETDEVVNKGGYDCP